MELIRGLQSIEQELRLPLTHPILPADEPSGETRGGGDTIARPRARGENTFLGRGPASGRTEMPPARGVTEGAWGQGAGYADPRTQSAHTQTGRAQPGQQPWGQTIPPWSAGAGTHDATITRGTRPGGREDDQTRMRAPMRVDPWGPAGPVGPTSAASPVDDDRTRTRGPVRLNPWGTADPGTGGAGGAGGTGNGFPEFQPGGREGTTMARPAALQPGGHAAARTGSGRPSGRVLALGGGLLVVVVAVAAFFTLGRGNGQQGQNPSGAGQSTASSGEQNALGPGATAPGQPTVTAQSAGAAQVRFSWTYANPAAGDTFRWQRVSGSAGAPDGATSKPDVVMALPQGQSVCIEVQVRRAGGQASDPSQPVCWPSLLIYHNR